MFFLTNQQCIMFVLHVGLPAMYASSSELVVLFRLLENDAT